ncbi:hypothetical protein [cf. Phormidesmis sp. LEGE 11477]|nr:hypothetical protein [cf. Phormidesmis sp. LEGE 11477]
MASSFDQSQFTVQSAAQPSAQSQTRLELTGSRQFTAWLAEQF